jgi:uncharacterized RDD family membrane protein YckC
MLDTTRRVATPEGIELTLQLAGPVPRALAWTIDLLLRAALVLAVSIGLGWMGRAAGGIVLMTMFFVEWLLPAAFEVYWNGQTPGKRLFRLAVLNDDGSPVRWPAALTRNLLRAADFLPFFYAFGLLAMMSSRDFKRLGDLAAGTLVVHRPEKSLTREVPEAAALAPPFALTLAEQRAVLDLAERSALLTRERLEELAELPTPLVGNLSGAQAAARLLGMANYIVGQKR